MMDSYAVLVEVVLLGVLAYALWQRVSVYFRVSAKGEARPPRTLDLLDALLALTLFVFLERFSMVVMKRGFGLGTGLAVGISYGGAGVVTVLGVWLLLQVQGVGLEKYLRFSAGGGEDDGRTWKFLEEDRSVWVGRSCGCLGF